MSERAKSKFVTKRYLDCVIQVTAKAVGEAISATITPIVNRLIVAETKIAELEKTKQDRP